MSVPDARRLSLAEQEHVRDVLFAAARGERRLTEDDACLLLEHADLLDLGAAAAHVRNTLHPDREVTFVVDRNINYTNVCTSECRFCAFFRPPGHAEAYLLDADALHRKVEETLEREGTAILLQGGLHPDLRIEWYEQLLSDLKSRYPIHVHGFGPPEIVHISKVSAIDTREVLERLRAAGLDSLPGGGAEILVDRIRSHVSPKKATSEQWLGVMRQAHEIGMSTTATMMFGSVETRRERVEHLSRIRDLQDHTGGFRAFIAWTFQPGFTQLSAHEEAALGRRLAPASGWEYLRVLAVSRLYLDNVANIQASWVTQGAKVGQLALAFGANDLGSTMIEENVVAAAGVRNMLDRDDLVRLIRDADFTPVQRDTLYREVRRF